MSLSFKFEGEFHLFVSFSESPHLIFFSRFANRSARFIAAYGEGLSGAQASWANKKYHSHRKLPPHCILDTRNAVNA
jgi:hypothetical protein